MIGGRRRGAFAAALMASTLIGVARGQERAATGYPVVPPTMDHDLTLYLADGRAVRGGVALERIPSEADLIIWVAGNQVFAMDSVVHAFQSGLAPRSPRVALLTLPPGLLLDGITRGGLSFRGTSYPGRPDVYGSVSIDHLRVLQRAGLMDSFAIYMHNEIELMVAAGNPKRIRGIDDLARAQVRSSLPNPVDEGIMRFYGRPVLERHGLWARLSQGRDCSACQTTPNVWFTAAHHRETPERIIRDLSDVGLVWRTENLAARRAGAAVEGVSLPAEDNAGREVIYVIAPLERTRHRSLAGRYLTFLASAAGQDAYAAFGFVRATTEELRLRPIPPQ